MDARLTPLPALTTIELRGLRRRVRETFRWITLACLAGAFVPALFETHRVCGWSRCTGDEPVHHLWHDVGPLFHLALVFAGFLTYLGRNRKMTANMIYAAGTAATLFVALVGYVVVHFLSSVEGEGLGVPGLLLAFVVALVSFIAEPILTARERRHQIVGDPVLAHARVVR